MSGDVGSVHYLRAIVLCLSKHLIICYSSSQLHPIPFYVIVLYVPWRINIYVVKMVKLLFIFNF